MKHDWVSQWFCLLLGYIIFLVIYLLCATPSRSADLENIPKPKIEQAKVLWPAWDPIIEPSPTPKPTPIYIDLE